MKRKILVAVFMLLSIAALGLSNNQVACAFDFCYDCQNSCYDESGHAYYQCRENGGSQAYCDQQSAQYFRNCQLLFCVECPVVSSPPRGRDPR